MKSNSCSLQTLSLGEGKEVCYEMMTHGKTLLFLYFFLTNYKNDIYNADEFDLFYKALPNKSLHLKKEKDVGGK